MKRSLICTGSRRVAPTPGLSSMRTPIVASLAGDIEVEAADYLYQNGIVAYAYSTEIPVAVLGAKYKWARGAGLL
jgi:Ligase-CoA domain